MVWPDNLQGIDHTLYQKYMIVVSVSATNMPVNHFSIFNRPSWKVKKKTKVEQSGEGKVEQNGDIYVFQCLPLNEVCKRIYCNL